MKYGGTLLVVRNMEKSRQFYEDVMGQKVASDFGANITFESGFSLQTLETWVDFIGSRPDEISYGALDAELYFEDDGVDAFAERLEKTGVDLVHDAQEQPWGQRVVRFFDPDFHIIEVGEPMESVIRRLLKQGLGVEDVSKRTMFPVEAVKQIKAGL